MSLFSVIKGTSYACAISGIGNGGPNVTFWILSANILKNEADLSLMQPPGFFGILFIPTSHNLTFGSLEMESVLVEILTH